MDALKTKRKSLRISFTTCENKLKLHLASVGDKKVVEALYALRSQFKDKFDRLDEVQNEISSLLLEDPDTIGEYESDFQAAEEYRDNYLDIESKMDAFLDKDARSCSKASTEENQLKVRLPKVELKTFSGDPKDYLTFWSIFSKIHESDDLSAIDKFQYLYQSMVPGSKASRLVSSFPITAENYPKAIQQLKLRFGREDLLVQIYVRDLLSLVMKNATFGKNSPDLATLYDLLETKLRALESLGRTKEKFADFLEPLVESCLPENVLRAWERSRVSENSDDSTSQRSLEKLMCFLRHEVESEEMINLAREGFGKEKEGGTVRKSQKSNHIEEPTASTLIVNTSGCKNSCLFCDRPHQSHDCQKIADLSYEERKSQVMRKGCCLVCLKSGHMARKCHSKVRCLICKRRHYALLCPDLRKENSLLSKDKGADEELKVLLTNLPSEREIYLKTIMLKLRNRDREVCVRALMDDGSQRSYVERSLAVELNLHPSGIEVFTQGLFGGGITPASEHKRYKITVESLNSSYSTSLTLLDQLKICSSIPRIRDGAILKELASRGVELNDVGIETPPIRVLLGADVIGSILTGKVEVLKNGISAIETRFGWTVLGLGERKEVFSMVTLCLENLQIQKMWDLDTLGISDPIEDKTKKILDEETLFHFQETVKINMEQRYEVSLPWLAGHPSLSTNREIAESRLKAVTKRLDRQDILLPYHDVFLQWKSEGIIEEVEPSEVTTGAYYLPHRPVVKLSSATTKIRPVFDASFKTARCASLNDCLSTGPSLTEQIPPLLNRFRIDAIGVTADIKQAFLQISVQPEDRNVLRFLWWEDLKCSKIVEYRHCRVVFGLTASPFLLNATISHHLNLEKFQIESFAFTMAKLKEGFYVDNLVTSVKDDEDFELLKKQAREVMAAGCFDLRCWTSTPVDQSQSVLGLQWNIADELACAVPKIIVGSDEEITKRTLLSTLSCVYDPIGFSCPAMLFPKLILQEAWRRNLGWDDALPEDLQLKFKSWNKHIDMIEKCSIPRRMFYGEIEEATLHIFSDASAAAYACCAFLRCKEQGKVFVSLVSAKSRVAPMNKPTIPRMELLGATIAARLYKSTIEALGLPLKTSFWTDSMVVLAWIQKKEQWNTFVGNRVKEIRELTDARRWGHISGELNPADLPSRSCTWLDLYRQRWWEGPEWLYGDEESWPNSELSVPDEALLERRKTVVSNLATEGDEKFGDRFLYFSNYTQILRMTAYVLRFCNNIKKSNPKLTGGISFEEIERAENTLIKIIQSEWPSEVREKYEDTMQFSTEDGILRVQTRLILSQDPEDFTRPIVLPDHPLLKTLILYTHRSLLHAGVLTTLAKLRERFWIPKGRRIVREVLRRCIPCKRLASKNVNPDLAPLPPDRINRVAAFQITGADLAGPLILRGGSKAWIVLFTCAVYRAVHLELISSLSTEAFMQALRRFWARRGRCSTLYTDNGTNFVGTANALNSLDWNLIQSESALMKMKWIFSPPSAPWYGGFWERMVRCVKELLRKCLGKACVTYEEMLTLLCDCEAVVNGRPLTYLSDDPNELKPLTPAHFIQDLTKRETVDLDLIDSRHLLKRVRYLQTLRLNLRNRFYKEYLGELVRNPKSGSKRRVVSPGEIVLVESKNPNKMNWPLAQVIELFPGKDKVERVAKLRVATGEIVRPLQRLYPLELSSMDKLCDDHRQEIGTPPSVKPKRTSALEIEQPHDAEPTGDDTSTEVKSTRFGRRVKPVKRMNL